jgi:hypothetical protein
MALTLLQMPLGFTDNVIEHSLPMRGYRSPTSSRSWGSDTEYLDAGVQLGWLINPQQQQVEIYRPGQNVEVRNLPTELSGETILPGFSLSLSGY